MPSSQPAKPPRYSSTCELRRSPFLRRRNFFPLDEDGTYQYRHVILDKGMVSLIPKNRLMDECEWRALGIKQGAHWEHYLIHKPGNIRFMTFEQTWQRLSLRTICSHVPSSAEISRRLRFLGATAKYSLSHCTHPSQCNDELLVELSSRRRDQHQTEPEHSQCSSHGCQPLQDNQQQYERRISPDCLWKPLRSIEQSCLLPDMFVTAMSDNVI